MLYKESNVYQDLKQILADIKAGKDISYGDIAFLTDYKTEIKEWFPDEPILWEWAGIPENEWRNSK